MEKKQTAVEWLSQQLFGNDFKDCDGGIIEQAKALEKSQIMKAQSYAISHADMTNNKGEFDCEQYYNQTYGTKNN